MVNHPAGSECAAPGPELGTSWARREDLDVAGTGRQRRQIAGFARQREPDFGAIWFKENVLGSNRRRHRTNVPHVKGCSTRMLRAASGMTAAARCRADD